ncbi:MAG: hypothetical protein U0X73_08335 [Thermoanaerobaculia bacterium]
MATDPAIAAAGVLTILGSGMAAARYGGPLLEYMGDVQPSYSPTAAHRMLMAFTGVCGSFAIVTLLRHWTAIVDHLDDAIFIAWCFLAMVAGVLVQVLTSQHKEGKPLFKVPLSRLLFPLLFAPIVFYPVWSLAASAPQNFFVLHAAFLNGYFWESVVAAAKRPPLDEMRGPFAE